MSYFTDYGLKSKQTLQKWKCGTICTISNLIRNDSEVFSISSQRGAFEHTQTTFHYFICIILAISGFNSTLGRCKTVISPHRFSSLSYWQVSPWCHQYAADGNSSEELLKPGPRLHPEGTNASAAAARTRMWWLKQHLMSVALNFLTCSFHFLPMCNNGGRKMKNLLKQRSRKCMCSWRRALCSLTRRL